MSKFKTITEAVLRNSAGGELDRTELQQKIIRGQPEWHWSSTIQQWWKDIQVGDTITIEERETEVE